MDKEDVSKELRLLEAIHQACSDLSARLHLRKNYEGDLQASRSNTDRLTRLVAAQEDHIKEDEKKVYTTRNAYADYLGTLMVKEAEKLTPVSMTLNVHDLDSLESRTDHWESEVVDTVEDNYPF